MASRHGSRYEISINDVNLNKPQENTLDDSQDLSSWTHFNHSNQHLDQYQPAQALAGAGPSMLLMENTESFPESSMNLTSRGREREEEAVNPKQKRIMKNRESAARSRARKMAYRNELENKVICLEEELKTLQQQKEKEALEQCHLKQEKKGAPPRRANSASF